MKWLRRLWAMVSQPGTGGLIQPGDWRCVYPDGERTYWMSYGDAINCRTLWGGKVEWRGDVTPNVKVTGTSPTDANRGEDA